MFRSIRTRLLIYQLIVLTTVLAGFAIAVRVVFSRSLFHQLEKTLTALSEGVASESEYESGTGQLDDDTDIGLLLDPNQGLQWFDSEGDLVKQYGSVTLIAPISITKRVQIETTPRRIMGVTVPIYDGKTHQCIAYVRVSQSLDAIDNTLQYLDWGLTGGIIIAIGLSGIGSVWLTEESMKPIEQSFRRLQQFTSDASHELRNPIMAAKSNAVVALKYSEGMRKGDEEKFQAIVSAMSQMAYLTEDLLFLARTDQAVSSNWEMINLTVLLTGLVQLHRPQATAKSLDLIDNLDNELFVNGAAIQLTRLFENLITNAIHYTKKGKIEVVAVQINTHIYVSIRDTGVGIAPEHLNHIFDRFWRADQSRTQWDGGSGLGLAIAQEIVKIYRGKITVTSQLSIGSCFTVELPTSFFPKNSNF